MRTNRNYIEKIFEMLRKFTQDLPKPAIGLIAEHERDPFKILISTVMSARTKDDVTVKAAKRLFSIADTPEKMLELGSEKIGNIIFPVGFYNTKSKNIIEICRVLISEYNSIVPSTMTELLGLLGVGRKTANLVLIEAFDRSEVCVDTHVHRISNRLGFVRTDTTEDTEIALRKILNDEQKRNINDILVRLGQNVCVPISPFCSKCPVNRLCPKIGVGRQR